VPVLASQMNRSPLAFRPVSNISLTQNRSQRLYELRREVDHILDLTLIDAAQPDDDAPVQRCIHRLRGTQEVYHGEGECIDGMILL
jgi:hypothetical protein